MEIYKSKYTRQEIEEKIDNLSSNTSVDSIWESGNSGTNNAKLGTNNTNTGNNSVVIGVGNKNSGSENLIVGLNNTSENNIHSIVCGTGNELLSSNALVCGMAANNSSNDVFSVGNGDINAMTGAPTKHSALNVKRNGVVEISDVYGSNLADNRKPMIDLQKKLQDLENYIETSYSNLVTLRSNSNLIPGVWYRINDYGSAGYNINDETKFVGNRFDILVLATSTNTLSEEARAILHEGSEYFNFYKCNLDAWKIWYCLDNDTNRFAWASAAAASDRSKNKGVIYRMIDEFNNDVPYDFKNIVFARYKITDSNDVNYEKFYGLSGDTSYKVYRYTFDGNSSSTFGNPRDTSIENPSDIFNNIIKPYTKKYVSGTTHSRKQYLNNIVFNTAYCYNNVFNFNCYNSTFGNNYCHNSFDVGCFNNSFGDNCYSNSFGNQCNGNSFGNGCYSNSLGNSCYNNSFGNECRFNSFGNCCYENKFGNNCDSNSIDNGCHHNLFGITNNAPVAFGENGSNYNSLANYCRYIYLYDGTGCNNIMNQCSGIWITQNASSNILYPSCINKTVSGNNKVVTA